LLVRYLTAAAFMLTTIALNPMFAQAQEQLQGWYQIDVILFKPKSADLDEESWSEIDGTYPANVIAVTDGEVFKLSQLEQLGVLLPTESDEVAPELGTNDFAFEGQSNRNRNRRVIERVTGVSDGDSGKTSNEADTDGVSRPIEIDSEVDVPAALSIEDIIDTALAQGNPNSEGALAFSSREADSSLKAILRSLGRSSRFTVLSHQSWVQPVGSEPTPVLVQAGKRYDDRFEVEGTLSFTRSRFLHVQTNLWYTIFEPRSGESNPFLAGFQSNLSDETLSQYPELVKVERERGQYFAARTHLMFQSRRMRSDELHYIDHPLFGIVVRINRFKPEA
jgi:hypothetical protein